MTIAKISQIHKKLPIRLLVQSICMVLLMPFPDAKSQIILDNEQKLVTVTSKFTLFTDTTKALDINQVISQGKFNASNDDVLNLGIDKGSNWLQTVLINKTHREDLVLNLEQPVIDEAELFVFKAGRLILHKSVSSLQDFSYREYGHQNPLFRFNVPTGDTVRILVKVTAEEALHLPIKLGVEPAVLKEVSFFDFLSGLYYGLMLVMVLYNLFVWYSLRDPLYLYYVAYVFCVAMTQACLQGYGYRFLWPSSPNLQGFAVLYAGASSGITSLLFIQRFLHLKVKAPLMDKLLNGVFWYYLVIMAVITLGYKSTAYQMIDFGALVGALLIFAAAIVIARQGDRSGKFILVSWTLFLVSVIIFVVKDFDLVPYNTLTSYSLLIGSGAETVLLSFALADRINILKFEKEQSQAQTIQALQENERLITEQNIILETKVTERTRDLKESNDQLSVALTNLKEAQTQLVESEKMATLGQLTAGIAHEINNPINFVISNVKPLRRDFDDLKEALSLFDDAAKGDWSAEKASVARKKLQELDVEYVIDEANQLLDGIDEGANRTSQIVAGLRNFSRLDERSTKKTNIIDCVESTLVLLNSSIKNQITLVKNYAELDKIECQPGKINQVMMNILTNAIQAFEESSVTVPTISIETKDDIDHIKIIISDNGKGMPEDVKKHIFEPFFSTKEVGKGTGLGLSIVHGIIKQHHGEIIVDSALGLGTSFTIRLPKISKA